MAEEKKKFYITTAIPYVNARPHIGHALEFVQADVIARYHKGLDERVLLLSGSDDNALKNVQAAETEGVEVQAFVDKNAGLFFALLKKLEIECNVFQRGSDKVNHYPASQKLWKLCEEAGDIYKKSYEGLYCVGCEAFYAPDELNEKGECFQHPGRKLEIVSEENYFFRLSKYQQELIQLIQSDTLCILPNTRKNEVLGFLQKPLQDISISRSNARARNWGVPIPGDDSQRMYVWFDALNIYQSGIGFGWDEEQYRKWWPADVHLIGKDIIRFHAVYWPAFLLSAKLPLPKSLLVHGFVTLEGGKMSKTVGNVVDPEELISKYGTPALRYYLMREIPSGGDGDFSISKFEERYNGELANGLGNLVARVATLGERVSPLRMEGVALPEIKSEIEAVAERYGDAFESFRLNEAIAEAWRLIGFSDRFINDKKPWAIQDDVEFRSVMTNAAYLISCITDLVRPFLPGTAEKIEEQIKYIDGSIEIKKGAVLFPRLDD